VHDHRAATAEGAVARLARVRVRVWLRVRVRVRARARVRAPSRAVQLIESLLAD